MFSAIYYNLKKLFNAAFVFLTLLVCTTLYADETRITDIRFWQSPDEAQIVLDLSFPPNLTDTVCEKDGNIYFYIKDCVFKPGRQRYPLQNPFIDVLTVEEIYDGSVLINFKVPKGVEAKNYVLPSNAIKSDRIVIFLREPEKQKEKQEAEVVEVKKLKSENVKIVVLDPGHGGEDPGTSYKGLVEKNYVLSLAKLVKECFDEDSRFKVILTRDGDYIIPLDDRRAIAERLKADAFVSLHVNYNPSTSISGTEVYYESRKGAVTEAERLVSDKENRVEFADSVNPKSGTAEIISTVLDKPELIEKQARVMYKSSKLAEAVENELSSSVEGLPSRGVKRSGFRVLHSLAMPSILIEFGYISNNNDRTSLQDKGNKIKLARGVYDGIVQFLTCTPTEGMDSAYVNFCKAEEKRRKAAEKRALQRKEALKKGYTKYKIKSGDTLLGIAKKNKVSVAKLLKANNLKMESIIRIGQTIKIPAK